MRRLVVLALVLAACGSPASTRDGGGGDGSVDANDGTPVRQACTNSLGSALTQVYGRLDGTLVAIVQPGGSNCNADSDHVHLQVMTNGAVYDIAVDIGSSTANDGHTTTRELTFPAWSEGWHTGVDEDYVSLGIHSTDLPNEPHTQIASEITADLATVNHISIFGTGYGPDGAHLVHRNGSGHDGFVVSEPLSTPSHARLFSFSSQTF